MEHQNSIPSVTIATASPGLMSVDPFLVEALQNPRHRLTTHRVAQHYSLQTMVLDNFSDGQGTHILVRKLAETKYPAICLSDVPTKLLETEKQENVKIVLKPRPKLYSDGTNGFGKNSNSVRTVEERKDEYDKARARIFCTPGSPESDGLSSDGGKNLCFNGDDNEGSRNSIVDLSSRDGNTSRVAILRDIEKDLSDPDYDRSYKRYVRNLPVTQGFNLVPLSLPKIQPPYESVIPPPHHLGNNTTPVGYQNSASMSPYAVVEVNHIPTGDAVYMQWPYHSMMYAHTYDQFIHHPVFQASFYQQQPLSFDYSQNR